jgi:hypothetical protein
MLLIKHYALKAYGGSEYVNPRILYLGTRWMLVVSFTPRSLYPPYPLNRRLDVPWNRSGRHEQILPLPGFELRSLCCPATIPALLLGVYLVLFIADFIKKSRSYTMRP